MSVEWKRGKENVYGQYIIWSKCERFQIFRFKDWYADRRVVWELRDDCHKCDTFECLHDAKEFAQAIINEECGVSDEQLNQRQKDAFWA